MIAGVTEPFEVYAVQATASSVEGRAQRAPRRPTFVILPRSGRWLYLASEAEFGVAVGLESSVALLTGRTSAEARSRLPAVSRTTGNRSRQFSTRLPTPAGRRTHVSLPDRTSSFAGASPPPPTSGVHCGTLAQATELRAATGIETACRSPPQERVRPQIGDVIEVKTPNGRGYAQYTHEHRDPPVMGSLLRVLPGLFSRAKPTEFFSALVEQEERFSVFLPSWHCAFAGHFSASLPTRPSR